MNVDDALAFFGNYGRLAESIGVSRSLIYTWNGSVPIPYRDTVRKAARERLDELRKLAEKLE